MSSQIVAVVPSPPPPPPSNKPLGVGGIALILLFFGVFLALIAFGVWSTVQQFKLAQAALKQGNTGVAIAALAPEIGQGIGSVVSAF